MATDPDLIRKNARTGLTVLALVFTMIGLSFASVPLYSLFCRVTGFGGTPLIGGNLPETVLDRTITVQLNADTGRNMPWDFKPEIRELKLRLGEKGLVAFYAKSRIGKPSAGTALYNVTPDKAAKYFHKIQCFCFDRQVLEPHQQASLPVVFYIDPEMDKDPAMDDIRVITLSYTFYEADSKDLEAALQGFYNAGDAAIKSTQ